MSWFHDHRACTYTSGTKNRHFSFSFLSFDLSFLLFCFIAGYVEDVRKERAKAIAQLHANRTRPRTKEIKNKNTLHVAAAVCGTGSIARFSLLLVVHLVPFYPVYRFRPAFVKHAPPPGRMSQTIRNNQSRHVIHSRHTTPFIRTRRRKVEVIKNHGGSSAKKKGSQRTTTRTSCTSWRHE